MDSSWNLQLLCPQGSPGKNTGVGCHFLLHQSPYSILNPNESWASDPGKVNQKVHLPDHGFMPRKGTDLPLSNQKPSGTYTGMTRWEERGTEWIKAWNCQNLSWRESDWDWCQHGKEYWEVKRQTCKSLIWAPDSSLTCQTKPMFFHLHNFLKPF